MNSKIEVILKMTELSRDLCVNQMVVLTKLKAAGVPISFDGSLDSGDLDSEVHYGTNDIKYTWTDDA